MQGNSREISVLCVDDDRDSRELVATRLERESDRLSVRTEPTAKAALDVFTPETFDCIVSDYHLEEMDGVEFFALVRERAAEFPYLLLTRTGSEKAASKAVSAGVTDYVIKGFADDQYELLAARIERAVEHHRARRKAEQTERRLHELAEHTTDPLWMFSADWSELLFINSAHEDLFGQTTEQLEEDPTSFLQSVHPDDRALVQRKMEKVSGGESVKVNYRVRPTEEDTRWVQSIAKPIREDGAVVRVAGFTRDITDRKRIEAELEEKNARLETFTTVVTHDLRNPLNVARGNLELVREDGAMDRIDPVERSLDRMERLITDLLTLAREGDVIGETERTDLRTLAEASWQNVPSAGATLHVEDEMALACDQSRLGQAFENLFRNAIEHGQDGVTITVGTLENGFYIEDDGPGIPADRREALLTGGDPDETGSLSFGVAIVRRIVEGHDWEVAIGEANGGGARFEVTDVPGVS